MTERKPWREMTTEEINRIARRKCIHCIYRGGSTHNFGEGVTGVTCDYILFTGKRRPTRPEDCQLYKTKARLKRIDGDIYHDR